jgi:arginyl-tRNA synthetase
MSENLRQQVASLIEIAFHEAQRLQLLPPSPMPDGAIERPQNPEFGDFSTSLPLKLSRTLGMNPMKIADYLAPLIPRGNQIATVQIAAPGFINITLEPIWLRGQVETILKEKGAFGNIEMGHGQHIQVEYVSINPTGPIHVGAARWAVLGSTMVNILRAAGYQITSEYYVNDAGSQMEVFYASLFARYLQACGREANLPSNGYQGSYMIDLAQKLREEQEDHLLSMPQEEVSILLAEWGLARMLDSIRTDLERIGVTFDIWFSEQGLESEDSNLKSMKLLKDGGYLEERDGAVWFASETLGEDRDAVVIRSTGAPTYFASDIAYHFNKFLVRKFDRVIDIWGADHQGHVPRMKAAVEALGIAPERLEIIIGQMVTLKRGNEIVRASKRTGELVTLKELVAEVGSDACRYFFLARSAEAQMEFDLDLATRQSQENPVFYIQYAHARICSILRNASNMGISYLWGDVQRLSAPEELSLIRHLLSLPELVENIAQRLEPHHLPHHALELATAFHWFYERCRVLNDDPDMTAARLKLTDATRLVLSRYLSLMGMSAPEHM